MSLGYETKPVGPKFQIQVVVNGKAKDHLARLARDAGCTTAMYAQRLFDAAFAARCGVSGDEELERAIGVATVECPADGPSGAAPAPDAAAMAIATKARVRTRQYSAWRESAQWQLKAQFPKWTDEPVSVEYEMRRPRAGADIDNRAKPLGDALTGIVLKDDSQIVDLRIRWADVEGVHITVRTA